MNRRSALRALWDPHAAATALVLAAFVVVGASFDANDSAVWFAGSVGAAVGSGLVVLGLGAALFVPLTLLFRWLDGRRAVPEPASFRETARRHLLPTAGAILAGWLPWLLVHAPGNVDSDTITQRLQWMGLLEQTDHHPWFDTMVFGWFWDLGSALGDDRIGLFAFLLLQEAATAAGAALVLTYLGWLGMARPIRWTLTAAVAVLPVFMAAPSVMSKDAFAAVFWLPFLVLFVEAVRTRGRVLLSARVGAVALAIVIPLILAKRTNVYLVVVCAVVLLVICARRARLRVAAGTAGALLVTNLVWPLLVLPAIGIAPGTATDMLTIPVQQTARIVAEHGDEIPADERAVIDAVLRYDGLGEAYVPRRSDAVKGRWNLEAGSDERLAYARVWVAQVIRYPGTALSATAANTFEYFAPVTPMIFQSGIVLDRYLDFWEARALPTTTRAEIEAAIEDLHEPAALDDARLAVNRATESLAEGNLLSSKAFYASWVPLIALAYAIRRRSPLHVLAVSPLLVNLAFLVASPVALPRYILPLVYGSVLAIGMMLTPVRWQNREDDLAPAAPAPLTESDATPG